MMPHWIINLFKSIREWYWEKFDPLETGTPLILFVILLIAFVVSYFLPDIGEIKRWINNG
jgi:hypothetical protein